MWRSSVACILNPLLCSLTRHSTIGFHEVSTPLLRWSRIKGLHPSILNRYQVGQRRQGVPVGHDAEEVRDEVMQVGHVEGRRDSSVALHVLHTPKRRHREPEAGLEGNCNLSDFAYKADGWRRGVALTMSRSCRISSPISAMFLSVCLKPHTIESTTSFCCSGFNIRIACTNSQRANPQVRSGPM